MTKSLNKIAKKRVWTDEEKRMITLLYPSPKTKTLAKLFKATLSQIYNIAFNLGLPKSQWFKDSPMSGSLKHDNRSGNQYRFKKGHVPPNKGKKITPHPNTIKTQFKQGQVSPNHRPVGTYRVVEDGYLEVKMAEGMGQWKQVSRIVWQRCNGPIPEGYLVTFIDGNKLNVEVTNLRLMTKAENAKRNHPSKYGKEFAQVNQLKGAITRQINKRRKENEQRHLSA
jgi:hypothetical protein